MKQYLELLTAIKERGTYKPAAREGMPGTQSLFGYQFRHNLADGFPLLTTKKMFWKGVVIELLWFLQGDTNVKYLIDNGVNIWNEDAYNYFNKKCKENNCAPFSYDIFIEKIKSGDFESTISIPNYKLGDCGFQYGKVWRRWEGHKKIIRDDHPSGNYPSDSMLFVDQIMGLIYSLRNSPEGRRHIVTAWDPAHDKDLALTWCHALFQFNCRPLTHDQQYEYCKKTGIYDGNTISGEVPKYYLDCQLYQRSADVFLGVPFNIASYALLTHVLAKICNMVPGEFIHTFGDVHIYDNHREQVEEQLTRTPQPLPQLYLNAVNWEYLGDSLCFDKLSLENFKLNNYNPLEAIKAELSTGLKK